MQDLGYSYGSPEVVAPSVSNEKHYPNVELHIKTDYKVGDKVKFNSEGIIKTIRMTEDDDTEICIELQTGEVKLSQAKSVEEAFNQAKDKGFADKPE